MPSFSLSAAATTLTQKTDSTATDVFTVTPQNGFRGTVSYSTAGLPSGVTGSFQGNTLQLSVAASTATGQYPLVITGSSDGSNAQVDVTLSVVAAAPSTGTAAGSSTRQGGGALDIWSLGGLMVLCGVGARRRVTFDPSDVHARG
jgi:hypothetical protein